MTQEEATEIIRLHKGAAAVTSDGCIYMTPIDVDKLEKRAKANGLEVFIPGLIKKTKK